MVPIVKNNIATLRKRQGLSQADLAATIRISITQLSRLERGSSSLTQSRMVQLAKALDVSPEELFLTNKARGHIDLEVIHEVVVQINDMLDRLNIDLTSKQVADLTVEFYQLEMSRLEGESNPAQSVELKRYESIVQSLSR